MNKASGGDGIPVELFIVLKDDAIKVLHSVCQQTWETQQWPQDWKRSVFIPNSKKGNAKECSNYHTVALISRQHGQAQNPSSYTSIVREPTTSRCTNWVQKKQRNQRSNCQHLLDLGESKGVPKTTSTFVSLTMLKPLTVWKILKETGVPDHLTCLLKNLYAGQEATAKTRHGTVDRFKIGKRIQQGCIMSSSLFNLHEESIV